MQRTVTQEILDSPQCPADDAAASLRDLNLINRWFGGVSTTRKLIERVAAVTGQKHFSMLEVAAGFGEVPRVASQQLGRKGITLGLTLLDLKKSHLLPGNRSLVADALSLPFADSSFDLISCNLFTHHLEADDDRRLADAEPLEVAEGIAIGNGDEPGDGDPRTPPRHRNRKHATGKRP